MRPTVGGSVVAMLARVARLRRRPLISAAGANFSERHQRLDAVIRIALLLVCLCAALLWPSIGHPMEDNTPKISIEYSVGFDVPFAKSSATVSAESKQHIQTQFARTQTQLPPERQSICAIVVGHAEVDEGSETQLIALSRQRAATVADQLLLNGMNESGVQVRHVAATQPIAARPNRKNSRVEVEIFPCK